MYGCKIKEFKHCTFWCYCNTQEGLKVSRAELIWSMVNLTSSYIALQFPAHRMDAENRRLIGRTGNKRYLWQRQDCLFSFHCVLFSLLQDINFQWPATFLCSCLQVHLINEAKSHVKVHMKNAVSSLYLKTIWDCLSSETGSALQ